MRAACFFAFATFLTAVAAGCDAGAACTDFLAFSVSGEVVDMDDNPIEDATVQYQVDDGPLQDCEVFEDTYACGPEVAGEITVVASSGDATTEMSFIIEQDECHVIGETAMLKLDI